MQCVTDQTFSRWLDEWEGIFDWDPGNLRTLSTYQTNQWEIESIFIQEYCYLGRIMDPSRHGWGEDRYLFLGRSITDKDFALICSIRDTRLRLISCRPQREGEKTALNTLVGTHHEKKEYKQ